MKRKWFILLIFLMATSLVGIIMIQLYWINNAIQLKEAQFDQNVKIAMKEIAEMVEKRENVVLISDKLKRFEKNIVRQKYNGTDTLSTISIGVGSSDHVVNIINDENDSDIYILQSNMSLDGESEIAYISDGDEVTIASHDLAVDLKVDMNYDSIRQTIQTIKGYYEIDTLSNAIFGNYVYTVSTGDSNNYFIVRHPDAKTSKARQLGEVFERMVIEAEDLIKPIEELYSPKDLNDVIEITLWSNGIDQKFEFAIESDDEEAPFPIKSESFSFDTMLDAYWISLFPQEIYEQKNYQLFLSFPDKNIYMLKSISLLLIISAILTLIILTTFGTTIYMILRQKRISDIKTDFINNMTHEFKTPIATISLAVDSINNPKTLDKKDNILYYTGIIKEENKRMNSQVENVLQMSLLDKHEIEFNMQPYDLHELIRNAIRKISLQIEERNGKIVVNMEATRHIARVDEVHFTNAILNLLDNANKYSPVAPEITVSTVNTDQHISIKVQDQGIGMSKEVQKKIFEKFYRQTSGNIHNVKGFGLGLAYVRAILQVIKGKIKISSDTGKGSTFELIIPTIADDG